MSTTVNSIDINMYNKNTLGLGLDYQYANKYALGGIKGLCDYFRQDLSHLSIVSIPEIIDAQNFNEIIPKNIPAIHHLSGIAPADPNGPNMERLKKQKKISDKLNALWCLEDIGLWSIGPYDIPYFVPPIFNMDVAKLVAERIKQIQDMVSIPFLAEIPSCSFVVGDITLGEFFHYLIETTKCKMVLDVSHVFSYALATNNAPMDILTSLPLHATWEIHVAGGRVNKNHNHRYIDTHSDPVHEEVISLLTAAIKLCRELQAITYEIGVQSTSDLIVSDFKRLSDLIGNTNFIPFSKFSTQNSGKYQFLPETSFSG